MIEGNLTVVLVGGVEVARGAIGMDAGLSLGVRLDTILGELPAPGEEIVLRTLEDVGGRREYAVTVASVDSAMLIVSDVELISAFQERAIGRVATDLLVTIVSELEGEELRDLATPIEATIVNLSTSGLQLYCAVPLEPGYRFGFHLALNSVDLDIVAEALRREAVPRGFRHGCRLVGTTQREADALYEYILDRQIAQRHRTKQD